MAKFPDLAAGNPYPLGQGNRATALLRSPLWNEDINTPSDVEGSRMVNVSAQDVMAYG